MQNYYEQQNNQQQNNRQLRPRKKTLFSWPLVFLLIAIASIASCHYNFNNFFNNVAKISLAGKSSKFDIKESIGVIVIEGEITGSTWVTKTLNDFENDEKIKAIVIRIDSPGGSVAPCQEIYSAVAKFNKPVVVSMASVAASGGLYIAAAGDVILANRGTITGSIGVIMQTVEFSGTMEKIGATSQSITSGVYKDTGSPFRKMREDEYNLLKTMVDSTYEQFIDDLSSGRPKLTKDEVRKLADGRIYNGEEALKNGLIDELGGFEDALLVAAGLGGLPTDVRPSIVVEDGIIPWWESAMRSSTFLGINTDNNPLSSKFSLRYIYQPQL